MLNTVSTLLQQPIPQTVVQPLPSSSVPAEPQPSVQKDTQPAPAEQKKSSALGEDQLLLYGQYAGLAAGGGFAAYRMGAKVAAQIQDIHKAFQSDQGLGGEIPPNAMMGIQGVLTTGMHGAGLSAMVAAGVSVLSNGIAAMRGQVDTQTATSNVVSDAISGAMGGFTAVTAAGAGNLMLGAMGLTGLPLTVATVALGAAGGLLGGQVAHKLNQSAAAASAAANGESTPS